MNIPSSQARIPSIVRRLAPPVLCGLVGIVITIMVGNIPHSYSSLVLLGFLVIFTIAHVSWIHNVIQALRQDLKPTIDPPKVPFSSSLPFVSGEEEHNHNIMIEATYFQLLRDRLNISHASHIQAQCLKDHKTHIIQTGGFIPLLRENQLEILVQPIVSLPQKRLSYFYCVPCVTLENGMNINLNTMTGSPNNLLSTQAIDRMILFQTLQFVRQHHRRYPNHGFVCSVSSTLFKDLKCLEEIGEFLHQSHFPFQAVIFEVPLDISDALFNNFSQMKRQGARFIGKWQNNELPRDLTELHIPPVDFITLTYFDLSTWLKKQPRRQSLESLQQMLELSPQTIISHVDKEQDLYQYLPVPFDFAAGEAFGLVKPFQQIQV